MESQPVALRDRLKQALEELEMDGVIEKVDQPTEWVNTVVVVEKPGSKNRSQTIERSDSERALQDANN